MKRSLFPAISVATITLLAFQSTYAYIGPGGGLTALGAILALVAVIVVTFFGFLWYPIKRLRKMRRERKNRKKAIPVSKKRETES